MHLLNRLQVHRCIGHNVMMWRKPGYASFDLDPRAKFKVKGQIMHFLVNASPPKHFKKLVFGMVYHRLNFLT